MICKCGHSKKNHNLSIFDAMLGKWYLNSCSMICPCRNFSKKKVKK